MAFSLYILYSKWHFKLDLNQTWYDKWILVVGDITIIFHGSLNMGVSDDLFAYNLTFWRL